MSTALLKNTGSLTVIYSGWLLKKNPFNGSYQKRFLVLTTEAIHWFKKDNTDTELLGIERGKLNLVDVLSVRILDEDDRIMAIQSSDRKTRFFRGEKNTEVEEWVAAIRSIDWIVAWRSVGATEGGKDTATTEEELPVVVVSLVSVHSPSKEWEYLLCRTPLWDSHITLQLLKDDTVVISTVNGGVVTIPTADISRRASDAKVFAISLQGSEDMLPQALQFKVEKAAVITSTTITTTQQHTSRTDEQGATIYSREKTFAYIILVFAPVITAIGIMNCIKSVPPTAISYSTYSGEVDTIDYTFIDDAETVSQQNTPVSLSNIAAMLTEMTTRRGNFTADDVSSILGYVCLLFFILVSVCLALSELRRKIEVKITPELPTTYFLRILQHQYLSHEDVTAASSAVVPMKDDAQAIPQRFLDGCNGDVTEARRRWSITQHWRETEGVDHILHEPQPHFFTIREHFPHYHAGRGKLGHPVYWERTGEMEIVKMKQKGVLLKDVFRHWIFMTEYLWTHLSPDDNSKGIFVLDVEKVSISDVGTEKFEHAKKTIIAANTHYPERSYVVFVVNAPSWSSFVWKLLKPFIDENTQKKIKILSKAETFQGLLEHMDVADIPEYYGGSLGSGSGSAGGHDYCRFHGPLSVELDRFVRELNAAALSSNVQSKKQVGDERKTEKVA